MANVVGDAYVMVRAITSSVDKDIKKAFSGVDKAGEDAGSRVGQSFNKGFQKQNSVSAFNNKLSGFLRQADAAKDAFSSLTRAGFVLQPALTALGGVIGVLGTTLISLGSIISAATLPALAVLAQSFTAAAQAAITLKLAFSGVGKAIQAGNKAKKSGASNAKALEKAERALERAQRALAKTYRDAAKSEVRAKRDLTDAEEELHKARTQAIEDLQQLSFDSEDAAIAEQKAAIELEKAREVLARVADLPPNSRARKEAELAFAQADLGYRRAIDRNNDLKETEAKNAELAKKGPEAVINGQENVISAIRAEQDARNALTETFEQNANAILQATEARDDAANAVQETKDNAAAADAYADALSELSKEAQAFAKYMVDTFIPALKALKTAAGEELFPKLETALENIRLKLLPRLIPLLKTTGGVIGDIAIKFSEAVTEGENLERLERIWKSNDTVLTNFGDAAIGLYESFLILLDTARPLTEEFSKWVATLTNGWTETLKADEASGKLNNKFQIARGILKDLGKIFGNTFGGLGKIISANVGPGSGGQFFLDYLKEVTGRFKNITTIDGRPLKDFFRDAAENGTKLLDLLGNIVGGFIAMADNEGLGIFLGQLNDVVDIFQRIGENLDSSLPAFGEFLIEFATLIETVTEGESVTIFFTTLKNALKTLNDFLKTDLGQSFLNVSAQVLPLLAAFGLIAKVGGFAFKVVVGSINAIVKPIMAISGAFQFLAGFLGVTAGTFALIVIGVAAVVAILVLAYQKSEIFREAIAKMVEIIKTALIDNFIAIKETIADAFPTGSSEGFMEAMKAIGDFIGKNIVPIFSKTLKFAIDVVGGAIRGLIYAFAAVRDGFSAIHKFFEGIFRLLKGDFRGAADSFKNAFSSAFSFIKNLFKGLVSIIAAPLNSMINGINQALGLFKVSIPTWVPKIGGSKFGFPRIPNIPINFAEGGTVFPRAGGVIARVAEAGQAERIEPLDAQGLSVRDRAIIAELSGPGKGTTINMIVNPSAGMDERELAAIVSRQIAFQTRRGAA